MLYFIIEMGMDGCENRRYRMDGYGVIATMVVLYLYKIAMSGIFRDYK